MSKNDKQLAIYMSEEEYEILKALAEKNNQSISEYCKIQLIPRDFTPEDTEIKYGLKDKSILIKVSEYEKAQLNKNAYDCGMSTAGYIRQRCLNSDSDFVMIDNELLRYNHYELCKLGTNLNQIAERLNSAKGDCLLPEVELLENSLESTLDVLIELAYRELDILNQGI